MLRSARPIYIKLLDVDVRFTPETGRENWDIPFERMTEKNLSFLTYKSKYC